MACRDVWNTWHEGLRSPQNPTAKPEDFVATGGPRAMYFTHHGKPLLKPIIARPSEKNMVQNYNYFTQIKSTTTAIDEISIDILKELLIFIISTHKNILAKNITW